MGAVGPGVDTSVGTGVSVGSAVGDSTGVGGDVGEGEATTGVGEGRGSTTSAGSWIQPAATAVAVMATTITAASSNHITGAGTRRPPGRRNPRLGTRPAARSAICTASNGRTPCSA